MPVDFERRRRPTSAAQPVERWLYPWALASAAVGTALGGVLAVAAGYRATFPAVSCVVALGPPTSPLAWRRHRSPA